MPSCMMMLVNVWIMIRMLMFLRSCDTDSCSFPFIVFIAILAPQIILFTWIFDLIFKRKIIVKLCNGFKGYSNVYFWIVLFNYFLYFWPNYLCFIVYIRSEIYLVFISFTIFLSVFNDDLCFRNFSNSLSIILDGLL